MGESHDFNERSVSVVSVVVGVSNLLSLEYLANIEKQHPMAKWFKTMTHYFNEPNSFRLVNCKSVPGERARKKCRQWNALVKKRLAQRAQGRIAEAEELERPYQELWSWLPEIFGNRKRSQCRLLLAFRFPEALRSFPGGYLRSRNCSERHCCKRFRFPEVSIALTLGKQEEKINQNFWTRENWELPSSPWQMIAS